MPDFSIIAQDPTIRAIVQSGMLERYFYDALYPRLMFRGEASPRFWPGNVGDSMRFTAVGLLDAQMQPLQPNTDPAPSQYPFEQWQVQSQLYADSIDTQMPTSIAAIASLFLRNAQQLGLGGALTLDSLVRDKWYNAALSGSTVANGAQVAVTTLNVQRLNGFTTARSSAGSAVFFDTVSGSNPLPILVGPALTPANVIGFTSVLPGDQIGPGALILDTAVTVASRDPVLSLDRSQQVYVGGGSRVDDIGANDLLRMVDLRSATAYMRQNNVPDMADGRFHAHFDPTSESEIFNDPEFQRLNTSLPDYFMYRDQAIGMLLGTVFYRNSRCPVVTTVKVGTGIAGKDAGVGLFSLTDPFAGELYSNGTTGVPIHRVIFGGQDGIFEYYMDLGMLITEAGLNGKVGEFQITNNSIAVMAERIQLIFRAPQDRLQQLVSASYKWIGDFGLRTDVTTGDPARYKREVVVNHA